jgi:membrane-associated phospholipid phosphatase
MSLSPPDRPPPTPSLQFSPPPPPDTIDDFLAPLIPTIVFILSLILVEVYLFRRGKVATTAAVVRFFMACWAALMVVGFLTELFKLICGRIRPDFLDRCKPKLTFQQVGTGCMAWLLGATHMPDTAAQGALGGSWGSRDSLAVTTPLCSLQQRTDFPPIHQPPQGLAAMGANQEWGTAPNPQCTSDDERLLRDGRVSFPSGHSSTSYVVGWFGCFYLLWGVSCRADMQMHKRCAAPRLPGRVLFRSCSPVPHPDATQPSPTAINRPLTFSPPTGCTAPATASGAAWARRSSTARCWA